MKKMKEIREDELRSLRKNSAFGWAEFRAQKYFLRGKRERQVA
jgi:hypothetical protein